MPPLRESPHLRYVPAVLFSGSHPPLLMRKCSELGIQSVAVTPTPADIMNALLPALELQLSLPQDANSPPIPLHVLLAEDNVVNQKLAVRVLEKFGHKVEIAANGSIAVDMFIEKRGHWDIILMDLQMPIMGGLEATQQIRRWEKENPSHNASQMWGRVPIVALTAHAMIGDREKCVAAGMVSRLSQASTMMVSPL